MQGGGAGELGVTNREQCLPCGIDAALRVKQFEPPRDARVIGWAGEGQPPFCLLHGVRLRGRLRGEGGAAAKPVGDFAKDGLYRLLVVRDRGQSPDAREERPRIAFRRGRFAEPARCCPCNCLFGKPTPVARVQDGGR